ncbi:unnamed protein product [Lymnaea stagnalis]|uniref:Ferric-chelate reductase 1 n=1 Tax=Lymnaea stagnalis TaxID=6523 RepID=A0AAV2HBF8_LYMST
MHFALLLVLFSSFLVCPMDCYSDGAPETACASMTPGHGSSTATGQAPYQLSLNKNTYNPGDVIEVTLSGNNNETFAGFLIAARRVTGETDNAGTFSPIPNTHTACPGVSGNAVTHSSAAPKSSVTFKWTAPSFTQGDLVFKYTVVKSFSEFFVALNSSVLKAVYSFPKDSQCGQTKGCYSDCVNNQCSWEVSWADSGSHYNITLKSFITDDNKYIALGFSNATAMGPASIVSCVLFNQSISVHTAYTVGHRYYRLNQPEDIFKNEENSYDNGVLSCTFQRLKESTANNTYNLTQPWYLIVAWGNADATGVRRHAVSDRYFTEQPIDLANTSQDIVQPTPTTLPQTTTTQTTSLKPSGTFVKDSQCKQSKGCYGDCVNNQCSWEVSWADSGSHYNITLKSFITEDNKYIALGFSNATAMGPASLVSCVIFNQSISVHTGYTVGHRYTRLNQPEDIIQNEENSYDNGVLSCTFQRLKETTANNTFNLTQPWYLIVARGNANAASIERHSRTDRYVTDQWIDLANTSQDIVVPTPAPTTPTTTTTTQTSTQTTTSRPVGHFAKDPGCGVTKGCYSDCSSGLCDWETSWSEAGNNYNITLKNYFTGDDRWVALGFAAESSDAMTAASVVSCIAHSGSVNVKISSNKGYDNTPLPNPTEGITNQETSHVNGVIRCSFLRVKESKNSNIYNLTQTPWYLITAVGSVAADGTMSQHDGTNRRVTEDSIDISANSTDISWSPPGPTTEPVTAKPGKFTKDPDCGKKKGCYSNCKNDECDLLLSWAPKADNFEITLKSKTSSTGNKYIALGFSSAAKMSDASVVACTVYQGIVDAFISKNSGYSNTLLPNPKEGISNVSGTYVDGFLQCTFTRVTSSPSNSEIYDLTKPWNLITARGTSGQDGHLTAHDGSNRFFTSSQIDFRDTSVDISLETSDYPLIKAHGCLMVIAWMISASIGLGFARFLKPLWPEYMPCGLKVWFAVHRGTMVLAFLLGCAGFILVFVEVQDYSEIVGEDYKKAHPILGIITTSLLVINPFMSLLRCAPDHPRRPIFNWAHRSVGTIAHILSIITITTGLYLPKAQVDSSTGLTVMIVYASWHLVFFLAMSLLDALAVADKSKVYKSTIPGVELTSQKSSKIGSQYTLNALDNGDDPSTSDPPKIKEPPKSLAKKFLIVTHVAVLCGLAIAILYLIIKGDQ